MPTPSPELHSVITNPEGPRPDSLAKPPPDPGKPSLVTRPCMYLTCFVKSLPVIFISVIICWSYYAYFVALLLTALSDYLVEQIVCGVIFNLIFVMLVSSYYKVVTTAPGQVPQSWILTSADVDKLTGAKTEEEWKSVLTSLGRHIGCEVKQRSVQNAVRYCEKCLAIKPDRSHHCSICEVCTLKMDHHCPWINNCVGFHNYKFFLLFLFYALTYCIFIATTSARHFINIWLLGVGEGEKDLADGYKNLGAAKYHILFVFVVSLLFTMSICSLFSYHVWLVLHNRTTLEQFRAPMFENNVSDPTGWSLGKLNNVREVFGTSVFLWPLPVSTSLGDGLRFPCRVQDEASNYQSIIGPAASCQRPFQKPTESPRFSRTLVNPVLGAAGKVETMVSISEETGDTNGHLTELKVER